MRRSHALAFASSLLASIPGLASGQSAPLRAIVAADVIPGRDDQIDLKNGGLLRGRIVALDPGKEVVIVIEGTGEQRRVPWEDVANVTRAKNPSASTPPPPASTPQPGAEPIPAPVDGAPRVHIRSDQPGMQLYMVSSMFSGLDSEGNTIGGASYRPVCLAPCDRIVDGRSGQLFFFASELAPQSSTFQLVGRGPEVSFDVKAGSAGQRLGAYTMTSLGGAAVAGGIVMLIMGAHHETLTMTGFQSSPNTALMAGGGALLGVGIGLAIGGFVLLLKSATTYTSLGPGAPSSEGKAPSLSPRFGANSVLLTF